MESAHSLPNYKLFSRKFSFYLSLLLGFPEFSAERFAFRKSNSFRNFWKLFREISESFTAVSKFSKVLVQWKWPLLLQIFENVVPFATGSCRKFKPDVLVEWKAPMFFWSECSKRKLMFLFFKAIFDTSFRPSRSFFGK